MGSSMLMCTIISRPIERFKYFVIILYCWLYVWHLTEFLYKCGLRAYQMQLWLEMCIVSEIYALHYSTKLQDYTKYITSIKKNDWWTVYVLNPCRIRTKQQRTIMINSVFLSLLKKMCTKIDVDHKKLFVWESIIKSITKSKSFPQLVRACGDQC